LLTSPVVNIRGDASRECLWIAFIDDSYSVASFATEPGNVNHSDRNGYDGRDRNIEL